MNKDTIYRRFTPIGNDEEMDRLIALVKKKGLSREDLVLILKTITLNPKADSVNETITIGGITFYYDPDEVTITDELTEYLTEFAAQAEDDAYTMYYDNGNLVVY